ncbi:MULTISPECIES: TetR/AcrR family transcriptional regulator [unclassified Saccharopolyspora]|uniref:TetR/AcrR family transcriptional regulator n=1 Tax=unclassified Saccharopolyspora TaxID=2646250 RepID=UPI001CD626B3|nr:MULTISPECIES: TetR/AcrR family transcriptional regulator [unclassified Saccharopolyspora]MCA1189867.1 TetR/AcrR family transcriptional regulator [Saccharopolyspora sp. 6T]MCA1195520.1 TetR/AcrR family transcriptional regulator [Saccharopolyspora sp. 6V]MCA1228278.1 TetR/AcrR family transcriptional regulator [Saccharopolyspora sp. 6M]MCA1282303.1 TetR/AcrR family transcriptional regulator [Saccharopolyspora sp. 7B]
MPLDPQILTPGARRILDAAATLFYELGITAVGVDLIAARSGVTKRTLYDRFGSKDVLVATYLAERDQRWRAEVTASLDRPGLSALDRVTAPFDALAEWTARHSRGCAFINALAELPDGAHPARRIAADEKRWLLELFERLTEEAGIVDSGRLARELLYLHEGALVVGSVVPGDAAADAGRAARALVAARS